MGLSKAPWAGERDGQNMKYWEYGRENPELLVMFHGGGTSYLGAQPAAVLLGERFYVILVAYDGFNPSEPETEFRSPQDEARRLGDYVMERYGGKIDVLYGLSYGCRVLLEVLGDDRLTITTTVADGTSLRDYPNIRSRVGKDLDCFFFTGLFYALMGHPGPRRKKFLAKLAGRTPEEAGRILYGRATWRSWKNQDYFLIGKKTDYTALPGRICICGTASGVRWTKSSPTGWRRWLTRVIPLQQRSSRIWATAAWRGSIPSALRRRSKPPTGRAWTKIGREGSGEGERARRRGPLYPTKPAKHAGSHLENPGGGCYTDPIRSSVRRAQNGARSWPPKGGFS